MTGAITRESVIALPRGVKLQFNAARKEWFLLGPERVFEPDEVAVEILRLIDGGRTMGAISEALAAAFQAPAEEIATDVEEFVKRLMEIRMLELKDSRP
jgi:pyrroloquinoline quinone biosynthesis protein D